MTALTTSFAVIRSRIGTLLPSSKELVNAYDLQFNSDLFLQNGYGVTYQIQSDAGSQEFNKIAWETTVNVILTRKLPFTQSDKSSIVALIDSMFTDTLTIAKSLLDFSFLDDPTGITKVSFAGSDAPIFFDEYVALTSKYNLRIVEDF